MFAEWVTMGVRIGITAFFGLFTFLLASAAVVGILGIICQLIVHREDEED